MSYIEMLLLSHLAKGPSHGYELRRQIEASTGVGLHNNSLYPALSRFAAAEAVTKTAEHQAGNPPRHVYTITDAGRQLLHGKLAQMPAEQAGDDAEFLTRVGQFEFLTPAERCAVLDARLTALAARAEHLAGLTNRPEHPWGAVVVSEFIRRTTAEQLWVRQLRALGGELPPPRGTQP